MGFSRQELPSPVYTLLYMKKRDFLGDPVANTLHSQCRGPGLISGQGTGSHTPQRRSNTPCATTKTQYSQINKQIHFNKSYLIRTYYIAQGTLLNSKLPICCLVAKSCRTLCDPMDCSTRGFPVHHHPRVCSHSCPLSQ